MTRPFPEKPASLRPQAGASIITAIFMLLLFAGLAAFMASMVSTANVTSAQDVQGARAYQAAQAGIEWGLYQVLDPANATVVAMAAPYGGGAAAWPNMPPPCATTTLTIEGFAVTVTCAVSGDYFEAGINRRLRVYQLQSTAASGAAGTISAIERQVMATVSKCRALDGAAPGYQCP